MAVIASQAEIELFLGAEDVELVLLQVLVVGERKPLEQTAKPCSRARKPAALARTSSAASGLRFWGMMLEPEVHASGSAAKPELLGAPEHQLLGQTGQRQRAVRRDRQIREGRVAGGDRVHGVGRHSSEAQLARPPSPGRAGS